MKVAGGADVSQGAWLRLSLPPTYRSTMYRALRLLARSRRLLRAPSAGPAISGEAGTLPRCAPNVARMVSEHLGLGLSGVTFRSTWPRCPRGPGLGSVPASSLNPPPRAPPPARCAGAAGTAEGRAALGQDGRPGRPAPTLSLQRPEALGPSGTVRAWRRMPGCWGRIRMQEAGSGGPEEGTGKGAAPSLP